MIDIDINKSYLAKFRRKTGLLYWSYLFNQWMIDFNDNQFPRKLRSEDLDKITLII